MNLPCIVSQQIAKHAQATGDAEERDEAIEARVAESALPGGEFDPMDADNTSEAFSEAPQSFWITLCALRVAGDAIKVLALIDSTVTEYLKEPAEAAAIRELEAERQRGMEDCAADRAQDRKWTDNFGEY